MSEDESRWSRHPDVPAVSAEELVGDELVGAEPRRYPSTIGGLCYLLVLAVAAVGLALVVWQDWRVGVKVLGFDLLGAAVLRLLLREQDAGMLAVRNKPLDAALLVLVGGLILVLAYDIPNQPGI